MHIDGKTNLIGFFGSTYKTSKMYTMYNTAIAALGLPFIYVPFAVNDLGKAVEGVRHLGIAAIGITIPYKRDIMPYLDELDEDAQRIGAVNVVVNDNGRLIGRNTDGHGALRALQEHTAVQEHHIVLVGAGGSARAIAFALHDAGARITIVNRTAAAAQELAEAIGRNTHYGSLDLLPDALPTSNIVIHTTPVGMDDTPQANQSLIPVHLLRADMTIMEIVTNPRETRLVKDATKQGCRIVYGYRMLLWQGVYKFHMYTGVEPPIDVMEKAMEAMK